MRVLAFVLLVACGKPDQGDSRFAESAERRAKLAVDKFAIDDFAAWRKSTPVDKACPPSLGEIARFTGKDPVEDTKDPWGTPYRMRCGDSFSGLKAGEIAVDSAGPDKAFDTTDDVVSWKKLH
jgi:hypothetical protein